jgi:hypothetical protein
MERFMNIALLLLTIGIMVAIPVCYLSNVPKEMADALVGLLGSLLGIFLGSFYIQRLVNRESSLKETSRWLMQKIDDYEKDACDCCFLAEEDSQERIILASKLKSEFPVLSNIFDACVRDKAKQNDSSRAWKTLFDSSTGDNFEFSPPCVDDIRPKVQQITRSCSQLKLVISQCL